MENRKRLDGGYENIYSNRSYPFFGGFKFFFSVHFSVQEDLILEMSNESFQPCRPCYGEKFAKRKKAGLGIQFT